MDKIKRKIYIDKIIEVMKNDFPLIKNMKDYGFYEQLSKDELNYVFSGIFGESVKVNVLGIFNQYGNIIYSENSNGVWRKWGYNDNGNIIYHEDSNGYWRKYEYDKNGNEIYSENSDTKKPSTIVYNLSFDHNHW
jgi:hypothetical protein